jgi:hypothetical protein
MIRRDGKTPKVPQANAKFIWGQSLREYIKSCIRQILSRFVKKFIIPQDYFSMDNCRENSLNMLLCLWRMARSIRRKYFGPPSYNQSPISDL